MADVIWSDDADLWLKAPEVLGCLPATAKRLVEGADGAADATGKVFTSAGMGSTFVSAGVKVGHFLEITDGTYLGFYRVVTAAAGALTLDRAIAASETGLGFRARTFDPWHEEVHQGLQDHIKRMEADEAWDDEDLHARSERLLRDVCCARVLARVFESASRQESDVWAGKARRWEARAARWFSTLGKLELDADSDGEADSETARGVGSVQIGIV